MRKLTAFSVFAITLLFATLIKDYFVKELAEEIGKGFTAVWLMMLINVAVYYPLFMWVDRYIKRLTDSYMRGAKSIAKSSLNGFLIAFVIAIAIIFVAGAYIWFDLNAFVLLF